MCSVHICVQWQGGFRHMPAHDEFSGTPKVSLLDRTVMITGLDRLRRTAAPRAMAFCATLLTAAGPATAADEASRWDGDARSAHPPDRGVASGRQDRAPAGRHPNQAQAGLAHLLEVPGGRRRAAALRLCGIAERQGGRGPVARAAAHPGGEPGGDRIYRRPHSAACDRAAERGEAGGAASQARLCGVREAVRARRRQERTGARRRPLIPGCCARRSRRRGCRRRSPSAKVRRSPSNRCGARMARPSRASSSTSPRRPARTSVLFAEGPTPEWALPVPARIEGAPAGVQRFAFELDGAPPGARYEGAAITLTAVAGDAAIEVATRLD